MPLGVLKALEVQYVRQCTRVEDERWFGDSLVATVGTRHRHPKS